MLTTLSAGSCCRSTTKWISERGEQQGDIRPGGKQPSAPKASRRLRTKVRNVVTGEVRDGLPTFSLDGKPVDLPILIVDGRAQDLGMWAIVHERESGAEHAVEQGDLNVRTEQTDRRSHRE